MTRRCLILASACIVLLALAASSHAAKLTVQLSGDAKDVTMVGAFERWDMDGLHNTPVNQNAKLEVPEVTAKAKDVGGGKWVFDNLKPGEYDLVIMKPGRVRIEGFHYPPVLDFDPFFPGDATVEDEETRAWIDKDIRGSRHYENRVEPLAMGGDDKTIRVLMLLLRDQATSYGDAGTLRFEVWQYDYKYGGWEKNRRTKVLHRVLLPRSEFSECTWLWTPKLGQVKVAKSDVTLEYKIPSLDDKSLVGLRPY